MAVNASRRRSSIGDAANGAQRDSVLVRFLMLGESGSGKTALVLRYDANVFTHNFISTIGVDFRSKVIVDDTGRSVKLQIWDTAGQERFSSLASSFFSRADGVVMVFDVTSRTSFERIGRWFEELKDKKDPGVDVDVCLCAAKSDLPLEMRVISSDEAKALADSLSIPYFETSAKMDSGVTNMFTTMAQRVVTRKHGLSQPSEEPPAGVLLRPSTGLEPIESSVGSCC